MTYDSAIALDQVDPNDLQHEVTYNELINALSSAFLFGINQRLTNGLALTLYGGNWPNSDGTLATVLTQTIRLTASATNYLYVTIAGVVTKVTSAPAGWPGPLANSARALYQLTVDANGITGGTDYVMGSGIAGPAGPDGAQGSAGFELSQQRIRIWEQPGDSASSPAATTAIIGFDTPNLVGTGTGTLGLDASTFERSFGQLVYTTGTSAGSSVQLRSTFNCWFRGNAAGHGGFSMTMRFATSFFTATNQRCFFGIYDVSAGVFGNVEPDTILNLVGVGSKAGDTNLSLINNDGSGTATMTTLGAGFPAKVATAYELTISSIANGSLITWLLSNLSAGTSTGGTISTDIPASTQFFGWTMWHNNGSTASNSGFAVAQVVGNSRY